MSRPLTRSLNPGLYRGPRRRDPRCRKFTVEGSEARAAPGLIEETVDLRDIVDAINQSGASTTSLIAILEALKSAGSLKAELVVI
ncbi:MAG: hypothetical protein CM15mP74_11030 [Halieaceae bacterium]|nr:MAG: hypothetical protein CM15mP74_11030 [Halieaceae bacterium]